MSERNPELITGRNNRGRSDQFGFQELRDRKEAGERRLAGVVCRIIAPPRRPRCRRGAI